MMPQKTQDCLRVAALPVGSHVRLERYQDLCQRWGEKVVIRKMERLADRDYIEYGVSPRMGWLTPKGQAALEAQACQSR